MWQFIFPKQGETRKSHGPIPHSLSVTNDIMLYNLRSEMALRARQTIKPV